MIKYSFFFLFICSHSFSQGSLGMNNIIKLIHDSKRKLLPANDEEIQHNLKSKFSQYQKKQFPEVESITAKELIKDVNGKKEYTIVDVREKREREVSVIPNAITLGEYKEKKDSLGEQPVVFYCTLGVRSGLAAQNFSQDGKRIFNLVGGILDYAHEGGKVVNNNKPTNKIHTYNAKWDFLPKNKGYKPVHK